MKRGPKKGSHWKQHVKPRLQRERQDGYRVMGTSQGGYSFMEGVAPKRTIPTLSLSDEESRLIDECARRRGLMKRGKPIHTIKEALDVIHKM